MFEFPKSFKGYPFFFFTLSIEKFKKIHALTHLTKRHKESNTEKRDED